MKGGREGGREGERNRGREEGVSGWERRGESVLSLCLIHKITLSHLPSPLTPPKGPACSLAVHG